jgi:hypothetical protein
MEGIGEPMSSAVRTCDSHPLDWARLPASQFIFLSSPFLVPPALHHGLC